MTWKSKNPRPCEVAGCGRDVEAHDLCHTHYAYLRRTGQRPTQRVLETIGERFAAKVDKAGPTPTHAPHLGPCWIWTGATDGSGRYGSIMHNRKLQRAHRVSWELAGRTIPSRVVLDHLCRTTLCVNPDHLQPVTQRTNVLRGTAPSALNAGKTHCPNGHPFTEENLTKGDSGRRCRICRREYNRERMRRVRAAKRQT